VPGAIVTPFCMANPERGNTNPTWPSGMATARPVGRAKGTAVKLFTQLVQSAIFGLGRRRPGFDPQSRDGRD
jgi:hypothetical protein